MTTLRELIKGSLRLINVTGTNEEPSADDMAISLEAMNALVSSMGNDLLNIYKVKHLAFPLTPNKQTYTLGPAVGPTGELTGADWIIDRPMRIEQARLMRNADIQMGVIPEPPDPPFVCPYVATYIDDNTVDLWLFNEALDAAVTAPTVSADIPADLTLDEGLQLSEVGACVHGLLLVADELGYDHVLFTYGDL